MSTQHSSKDRIEVPGDWYTIDFHVHSPASRDFKGPDFKGQEDSEDRSYLWLLEQAQKADLNIIVITDHNEIKGYRRLKEIETELKSTERTLARASEPVPHEVQRQMSLFDQLIILPGVELDAKPGVHYLIIFDPQKPLEEIEKFLDRGGYTKDIRGQKDASRYANWYMQNACQEAGELGAIVIAAHVDSDKGLYEITKHLSGQTRIEAFVDENLFGMEFINPVSRSQIENYLKYPDYKRETRLAFVHSSDFHGLGQQIGERRTWVRLDDVRPTPSEIFKALKKALRNPDEYVSAPGRPGVREIRKRLDDKPAIECLDAKSDIDKLSRYICAFANSEDGTVVIGRDDKGTWVGIECEEESEIANRILTLIRENVKPMPGFFGIEVYPYYGKKVFATVRVPKQPEIYSLASDDRVYLIEEGKPKQVSTEQVVQLAEENFLQKYTHLSITNRLAETSKKLSGIRDSLDILPIVRKMEAQTTLLPYLFPPPETGGVLSPELNEAIDFDFRFNGAIDGEVIVLEPQSPRLEDQYIRITAPLGKCDLANSVFDKLTRFDGDKIVIAPQGAVYLDSHSGIIAVCKQSKPVILQPDEKYDGPELKFVVAYLKSAIAIWYADRCLGSTDILSELILKVCVPYEPSHEYEEQVLKLVDQLVSLEHRFLSEEQDAIKSQFESIEEYSPEWREWQEKRAEIINSHNQTAGELMAELDKVFFEVFGLTDDEIEIVQQGVEAAGLKVFKCKES